MLIGHSFRTIIYIKRFSSIDRKFRNIEELNGLIHQASKDQTFYRKENVEK